MQPRIDRALVDLNFVRRLLAYDPSTGIFTWRINRGGTARSGSIAGSSDAYGYVLIRIGNINFKAHRLAWLLSYGEWPRGDIDHINGNVADNKIDNLRDVNRSQNLTNAKAPAHNTSGVKGVSWHKQKRKWRAYAQRGGKYVHLGYFTKQSDAVAAYRKSAEQHVGGRIRSTKKETIYANC